MEQGETFSGGPRRVTSYATWQFSGGWPPGDGWPSKNVHTDDDFARSCGLPDRAASGGMVQGYAVDLMVDVFGIAWLGDGGLNLKFIAPALVGDSITAKAKIVEVVEDGSRTRYGLAVTCENQRGEPVAVGTAHGWK